MHKTQFEKKSNEGVGFFAGYSRKIRLIHSVFFYYICSITNKQGFSRVAN